MALLNKAVVTPRPSLTPERRAHYEERLEHHQDELIKDLAYYEKFSELHAMSVAARDRQAAADFAAAMDGQNDEIYRHRYQINFLRRQLGLAGDYQFAKRRPQNAKSLLHRSPLSPEAAVNDQPSPVLIDGFMPDPGCLINQITHWKHEHSAHWFNKPELRTQALMDLQTQQSFLDWINGDLDE